MLGKFQYWIVKRWLLRSSITIIEKENGLTDIEIRHPLYGAVVLHPLRGQDVPNRESGPPPFSGYPQNSLN